MTDTSASTSSPVVETTPLKNDVTMVDSLDLTQYSGAGFEDVKSTDLVLPFWKLLQSAGNETKKNEPEYIKGATEGMWLDTVSKRLYRNIIVVPCKYVTHYIEWRKRNEGGGLIKNHGTDRSILDKTHRDEKTGKDTLDNGHEVITTATWFVLVIGGKEINTAVTDDPGTEVELLTRAVITFQSTALKASRGWVSLAQQLKLRDKNNQQYQPPMFAMSYLLGCVGTRNDAGSWVLPVVKQAGWTTDYPNAAILIKESIEYTKLANELHLMVITPQTTGDDDRPQRDPKASRYEDDYRRQPQPQPQGREPGQDDDIPF